MSMKEKTIFHLDIPHKMSLERTTSLYAEKPDQSP